VAERGWEIDGVAMVQSGTPLSFTNATSTNIGGTTMDLAYYDNSIAGCGSLKQGGSVQNRIGEDFNTTCFTNGPTISSDGGTGFGNTRSGLMRGPGQHNLDLSFVKLTGFDNERPRRKRRGILQKTKLTSRRKRRGIRPERD